MVTGTISLMIGPDKNKKPVEAGFLREIMQRSSRIDCQLGETSKNHETHPHSNLPADDRQFVDFLSQKQYEL
jgi:hypothetical protein